MAIDPTGRPVTNPVPTLVYETAEEEALKQEADKRKLLTQVCACDVICCWCVRDIRVSYLSLTLTAHGAQEWTRMLEQIDASPAPTAASLVHTTTPPVPASSSGVNVSACVTTERNHMDVLPISETTITLSRMFFPKACSRHSLLIPQELFSCSVLLFVAFEH